MRLTIKKLLPIALVLLLALVIAFPGGMLLAQEGDADTETATATDEETTDDLEAADDASAEERAVRLQELMQRVQELTQLLNELQERLQNTAGELRDTRAEIRSELRQGVSSDEVRRIQEVLATDPDVYPEGLTTGYFGPLTGRALERFQAKFDLEVTGDVNEETKAALETLLEERFGAGQVPPGLLRAPGIQKKFEARLQNGCDTSGPGNAPFCQKIKIKYEFADDNERKDEDDNNDELEVEVEIEDGEAKVKIEYADGDKEEFTLNMTDVDDIVAAIVDRTDLTTEEVEAVIEFDDERDDDDEDDEAENDDEDDDDEDE